MTITDQIIIAMQENKLKEQAAKIEKLEAEVQRLINQGIAERAETWDWMQIANDRLNEKEALRMEIKRLTMVTEEQAEDLAQADRDRKVLKQIWTEAEAAYTAERLKNADLQTAFNLQKEIARRHALRAEQAIRNLEEIGWQFAIANFSSEDVESLIDDELEGRDTVQPTDFPF